jgi:hypothetical protein
MPLLNAASALTAPADVDVELPVDGLAGDLDLELLGDVGLVEWAAAVGTDVGQGPLRFVILRTGLNYLQRPRGMANNATLPLRPGRCGIMCPGT